MNENVCMAKKNAIVFPKKKCASLLNFTDTKYQHNVFSIIKCHDIYLKKKKCKNVQPV